MKKIILGLAALMAAAGLPAQSRSGYSVTTDFTYTTKYIFRGIKNAGSSFQPSVEVATGDFHAGLWTNRPVVRHENDEIDLYAGYKHRVNNALSLEALVNYYWYPEAGASRGETRNSYEAGVGATYSTPAGLSPSVYYYHDFRIESDTLQGALGYSLPLERLGLSIDTSLFAGAVDARNAAPNAAGPAIRDSYSYYGIDLSVPYRIKGNATLTVGVHYADNRNLGVVPGRLAQDGDYVWFTAGLSLGF